MSNLSPFNALQQSVPQTDLAYDLAPLWALRQSLAGNALPIAHPIQAAITAISHGTIQVHWHLSSHQLDLSPPSLIVPLSAGGFRYGSLTTSSALHTTAGVTSLAHACGTLLQLLDIAAWNEYQRVRSNVPQIAYITARERDILLHLHMGMLREEVAARLVIARATLKTHLEQIYRKLDAHTLAQALVVGRLAGLFRHMI